jgi:hypothetical protein
MTKNRQYLRYDLEREGALKEAMPRNGVAGSIPARPIEVRLVA